MKIHIFNSELRTAGDAHQQQMFSSSLTSAGSAAGPLSNIQPLTVVSTDVILFHINWHCH